MKKLLLAAAALSVVAACNKKDDNNDTGCAVANGANFTYLQHIKPIIDANCLNCHIPGGTGPGDYRTFEGIKPYLDNGKVLDEVVVTKSMPQASAMPQSKRDSIECWIQSGYPK